MVSKKQLQANRRNARKSTGPKTPKGKARAARNSLKHGLLTKEVVIDDGEGAEDPKEFDALLNDLTNQFQPVGSLEEIMVEKIAVCYWRQRRAQSYEVGVLREKLDTITDDYYDEESNKTDVEIDEQIESMADQWLGWTDNLSLLNILYEKGKELSEIYDWKEHWEHVEDELLERKDNLQGNVKKVYFPNENKSPSETIHKTLNKEGHTDAQIWQAFIKIFQDQLNAYESLIEKLRKNKINNKLRIQVNKKCAALPGKFEMDNLLRYETAVDRQLYKAINQLERLQRMRLGDHLDRRRDMNVNTLGTGKIKLSKT